nr:transcriptional regulator ATRX homolog [Leptinotarsa decemlineata]
MILWRKKDNSLETNESNKLETPVEPPKSLIRLVDLSKLLDPKPKKSVKFDSSVIILTSSDEESVDTQKKKNSPDVASILRSVLKKSPSSSEENETKGSNEKQTKGKGTEKLKHKMNRHEDNTSDESDSSAKPREKIMKIENRSLTSKKNKKIKDNSKSKYSSESEKENSESNSDKNVLTSDEDETRSRKSTRLKKIEKSRLKTKANLRKIFKRNSGASSFEIFGEESSRSKGRASDRLSKKQGVIEVLSDSSSSSDGDLTNRKINRVKKERDRSKSLMDSEKGKFERKVYIPLPLIDCNKLKEVYSRNKKCLEISLNKLDTLGRNKRLHKSYSLSSSDAEKPVTKKSKIKRSDKSKKCKEDEDSSSENELISKQVDDVAEPEEKLSTSNGKKSGDKNSNDDSNEDNSETQKTRNEDKKLLENDKSKEKEKSNSESENESDSKNSGKESSKTGKESNEESSDNSKSNKNTTKNNKLSTQMIDSSDTDEEFSKFCSKNEKSRQDIVSKAKKRIKKTIVLSDSDESGSDKKKKNNSEDSDIKSDKSDSNKSSEDEGESEENKKPKRKRIKKTKDSSSSSEEDRSTRKQIRKVLDRASLSATTKKAEADEKERKARIAEKQKKYNNIFEEKKDSKIEKLVLDHDENTKKDVLEVHKKIVKKLKPHQANGIQFMWDACFESVERLKKEPGSGCILAHCMGLGKTLQVIALSHTLLTNHEKTNVNKVLIVCPLSTVLNWKAEFKKWIPSSDTLEVYELVSCKKNFERQYIVNEWHQEGGVLIISYAMFRNLSNPDNKKLSKKLRNAFQVGFIDPGPDLVVCDEGHLLKNEKTNLSIAMNRIKTARRIVLTGTPLQNNLKEYWCMVQFIKPNLLGTYKEYMNRFVNPITNGQYTDSTPRDTILMRKRSHVLHKLLDGVVQRRDYAVLEPYLPPKYEYVLFVKLSETQVKLYQHYMDKYARQSDGSNRTSFLFTDFQKLQRICTHPRTLAEKGSEKKEKFDDEESEGSLKDFIDDAEASSSGKSSSNSSGSETDDSGSGSGDKMKSKKQQKTRVTRAQTAYRKENNEGSDPELVEEVKKEWWQEYCDGEELDNINNSGKLFLLFEILKECEEIGDKVLIFSQSLYTLNCIEYFLEKIDEATQNGTPEKIGGYKGSWALGLDYFRLDGSSSCDNRHNWCDVFNNPNNIRARLFLISTKAGGLGINLVAANRVIIFDVSWNPSHDIQSIYRVYRFGQTKPCYIYRFVTYGTMEMKIYERQVTKQAISKRVIDEQQIDRHYNQNDLQELYKCDLDPTDRPIPMVPKDVLLGEMLQKHEKTIYKYHLHQSLLENKEDEGLNEEERKAAWEEFENEKVIRKYTYNNTGMAQMNQGMMSAQAISAALANIVRRDNPDWSEIQIKSIIPALVQQLQVQLAENDMSMYGRVMQEIQLMRAQKMREAYYQNQMMKLIQQQQNRQTVLGNLNVNPAHLAQLYGNVGNFFTGTPNVSGINLNKPSSSRSIPRPNDVIELND